MKLGLGTVQFGMDYGISNPAGKTPPDEVDKILDVAVLNRIRIVDTAALYGTSEQALGASLPADHGFSVVTKTPVYQNENITADSARLLEQTFQRSLRRLRLAAVYGLLAHHADDMLSAGGNLLFEKMEELKQRGLVTKIGVSVYCAEQIERILDRYSIDLIQLPLNVFDQRLLHSGHLAKLKEIGVEIHVRSVFLQGLLLMEPANLPAFFNSFRQYLARYREAMECQGLSPLQAALGFAAGLDSVDAIICGVQNHQQLEDICAVLKPCDTSLFTPFGVTDEAIINPSQWRCY